MNSTLLSGLTGKMRPLGNSLKVTNALVYVQYWKGNPALGKTIGVYVSPQTIIAYNMKSETIHISKSKARGLIEVLDSTPEETIDKIKVSSFKSKSSYTFKCIDSRSHVFWSFGIELLSPTFVSVYSNGHNFLSAEANWILFD